MEMDAQLVSATGSLMDDLDKKVLCVLRDGRNLIGWFRSMDHFANIVLQNTVERIYVGNEYGDISRGIFIVRGENVFLLGELDPLREEQSRFREVSPQVILEKQRLAQEQKRKGPLDTGTEELENEW